MMIKESELGDYKNPVTLQFEGIFGIFKIISGRKFFRGFFFGFREAFTEAFRRDFWFFRKFLEGIFFIFVF